MKQKFAFIALFLVVAQFSFAQNKKVKIPPPLVAEEVISNLVITDNIDVVFVEENIGNEGVKVAEDFIGKINARIVDGALLISTTKKRVVGERVTVYVSITNLETLTLKGNAFATSRGAINSRNLLVNLSSDARASIRSNGKIYVNATGDYQVVKEAGFSSLYALN